MFLSLGFLLSKSSLRDPSSISILYAGVREPLRFHLTYDVSFIRRLCPDSNQISGNRRLAVINEVTVDISECFIVIDRFDLTEVNILIPNIHKALAVRSQNTKLFIPPKLLVPIYHYINLRHRNDRIATRHSLLAPRQQPNL